MEDILTMYARKPGEYILYEVWKNRGTQFEKVRSTVIEDNPSVIASLTQGKTLREVASEPDFPQNIFRAIESARSKTPAKDTPIEAIEATMFANPGYMD